MCAHPWRLCCSWRASSRAAASTSAATSVSSVFISPCSSNAASANKSSTPQPSCTHPTLSLSTIIPQAWNCTGIFRACRLADCWLLWAGNKQKIGAVAAETEPGWRLLVRALLTGSLRCLSNEPHDQPARNRFGHNLSTPGSHTLEPYVVLLPKVAARGGRGERAHMVEVGENLVEAFGAQPVGQAPRAARRLHRARSHLPLRIHARAQRGLPPLVLRPAPPFSSFLLLSCSGLCLGRMQGARTCIPFARKMRSMLRTMQQHIWT